MVIRRKITLDQDGSPQQCPNCDAGEDQISIDNCEGYECLACGCWFDCDAHGWIAFARESRPMDLD